MFEKVQFLIHHKIHRLSLDETRNTNQVLGLLVKGSMLFKPKKTLYQVETIRDIQSFVDYSVNCDTDSYLVYNSPHSQKRGRNCDQSILVTVL